MGEKVTRSYSAKAGGTYSAAGDDALTFRVSGDTVDRFVVNADGKLEWGPGNGAVDTNLYRAAASALKTDDELEAALDVVARHGAATVSKLGAVGPASEAALDLAGEKMYRPAAGYIRSTSAFQVGSSGSATMTFATGGAVELSATGGAAFIDLRTQSPVPAVSGAGYGRVYCDTSAGKVRFMFQGPTGAAQQIAIEP